MSLAQVEGTQGFLPQLENDLEITSSMRLEVDSPTMTRDQWRAPPHHAHGDLTSLAPHERLPELPVVPRGKHHTCATARENPRDAPVITR